jgi:hypothetical protein
VPRLLSEIAGAIMITFTITALLITIPFIWLLAGMAISFDNTVQEWERNNEE